MFFTVLLDTLISTGHFVIAWQFWRQSRAQKDTKAKRALMYMIFFFVLCGVCGYLHHALRMFGVSEIPRAVLMVPLAISMWMFIARQEVVRIVEALERDAGTLIKLEGK